MADNSDIGNNRNECTNHSCRSDEDTYKLECADCKRLVHYGENKILAENSTLRKRVKELMRVIKKVEEERVKLKKRNPRLK